MGLKITNNATSVLAGSIDDAATTFSVASGAGALFPTLSEGDWFPLTIVNADSEYEIVRCTERSGDLFTVTRAQEGTSAIAFAAGCRVDLRLTAAAIAVFVEGALALLMANNLSDLEDVAAARDNLGLGTAALTASSDYATAEQGAKADSAFQPVGGTITGSLTTTGNIVANGSIEAKTSLYVTNGHLFVYGFGGDANQAVIRFNSAATAYLHFTGTIYSFTHHVYSPAGRLWGSGDFSTSSFGATSMRWVTGGILSFYNTEHAPYMISGNYYPGGVYGGAYARYLQYFIAGSWVTVGFA